MIQNNSKDLRLVDDKINTYLDDLTRLKGKFPKNANPIIKTILALRYIANGEVLSDTAADIVDSLQPLLLSNKLTPEITLALAMMIETLTYLLHLRFQLITETFGSTRDVIH